MGPVSPRPAIGTRSCVPSAAGGIGRSRATVPISPRGHTKEAREGPAERRCRLVSNPFGNTRESLRVLTQQRRRELQPPALQVRHRGLPYERGEFRGKGRTRKTDSRAQRRNGPWLLRRLVDETE